MNFTLAARARRLGMQQPNIARLEGGNYDRVSLPTRKRVARALGVEIEIQLSAVALLRASVTRSRLPFAS
ncbi:MAG: helix-turn-helix transcriptional regulator [Deltaproteobacteria bacterium]|nr:helix-turn-helix transcriptional regulator [Deltaproteobacteria bacterium]MDZ4344087.1 helix-turn-helix transcriptional regulator [Candidatus Binatia bacterium]